MIKIDSITISYGSQVVQKDFSLHIEEGEKVAIYGPSGSGKSSILASILGFVLPETGSISINGIQLNQKTVWNLRRQIGYVPQEPDLSTGTTESVINAPFSFRCNEPLKNGLNRLPEMLEEFALPETILKKDITSLSGGEKQRIAFIIALLLKRPILLLDEISSALDPQCRRAVINHLEKTNHTILLVTHDETLHEFCSRTISIGDMKTEAAS